MQHFPTQIRVNLRGLVAQTVVVSPTDAVSAIINIHQSRLVFNGIVLCPAMTFAFYGIQDNSTVFVVAAAQGEMKRASSQVRFRPSSKRDDAERELQLKRYFDARCAGKVPEPEIVMQKFRDAVNPVTTHEYARVSDMYRNRVETNTRAFRKLCTKYKSMVRFETIRMDSAVSAVKTVVPEKAMFPSTGLLPELVSDSELERVEPQLVHTEPQTHVQMNLLA